MPTVYKLMPSPVGELTLVAKDHRLIAILCDNHETGRVKLDAMAPSDSEPALLEAEKQLNEYFAGQRSQFELDLDFIGTPFQKQVWNALLTIPFGETRSYAQIAIQIGNPKAVRAVGAANGKNPISIVAPCHRVIGSSGALIGFAGGIEMKRRLLEIESKGGAGVKALEVPLPRVGSVEPIELKGLTFVQNTTAQESRAIIGDRPAMQTDSQTKSTERYKNVTVAKADGATYTPANLARFVASQIVESAVLPSKEINILDPAIGDGELIISLLEKISISADTAVVVHGFDINPAAIELTRLRISVAFPHVDLRLEVKDFLTHVVEEYHPSSSLFAAQSSPLLFDLIIANPPYVRTQIMGARQAQELSAGFGLGGRVDLYHAFLVAMAQVLKPTGTAGIIVSNRFMTTKSGATLRAALRTGFKLRHIWDLGDTKIFDAAVLPAVILAEGRSGSDSPAPIFTSIYETDESATLEAKDVVDALSMVGNVSLENGLSFCIKHGTLDNSGADDDIWRIATDATDTWLLTVHKNTWRTFGDVGKIRVGVKTCADKVFIRTDWHEMPEAERPELLRPLTTHHIARRFRASPPKKQREVIYPHETVNGQRQAMNLSDKPKTLAYLEAHRAALESRTYVIEGGRQWYELWVPQDPASWDAPKLVFRDISERPTFWLDLEGTIVNGDCYWMIAERGRPEDLLWLAAAVANSKFIEAFYDHRFNNKLYAGRRRFMTQYVEKFPLPDPETSLSRQIVKLTKRIYSSVDDCPTTEMEAELDAMIWEVFGLGVEEFTR